MKGYAGICWKKHCIVLKGSMELAAAAIRGLILTVFYQGAIGIWYPQMLKTLLYANKSCREAAFQKTIG